MKSKWSFLILSLCLVLVLASCSGNAAPSNSAGNAGNAGSAPSASAVAPGTGAPETREPAGHETAGAIDVDVAKKGAMKLGKYMTINTPYPAVASIQGQQFTMGDDNAMEMDVYMATDPKGKSTASYLYIVATAGEEIFTKDVKLAEMAKTIAGQIVGEMADVAEHDMIIHATEGDIKGVKLIGTLSGASVDIRIMGYKDTMVLAIGMATDDINKCTDTLNSLAFT